MSRDDGSFWDRVAVHTALKPGIDADGTRAVTRRVTPILKPQYKVLEFGGGSGALARSLAHRVSRYILTDCSAPDIHTARALARAEGRSNLECRVARPGDPGLPDDCDMVLAIDLLNLLSDLPDALRQIGGSLRSGGCFVSKTPLPDSATPSAPARRAGAILRRFRRAEKPLLTEVSLRRAIMTAGFDVDSSEILQGSGSYCMIVAHKLH